MDGFSFHELLERNGVAHAGSRVVRHDTAALVSLARGRNAFDAHVSIQRAGARSPYNQASAVFQFVPGPVLPDGVQSAVFVCGHRIVESWIVGVPPRLPAACLIADPEFRPADTDAAYTLEPIEALESWSRRLTVRWGVAASTRAWSQWTKDNPKLIIELRRVAEEPGFPGFASLVVRRTALLLLPATWQAALRSVRGIYLLTCPVSGRQYVGSAAGVDGIWGRWTSYAVTGHAGNKRLMDDGVQDWTMSVLELCSPLLTLPEVIDREQHWKDRLGSRAFGLNAN